MREPPQSLRKRVGDLVSAISSDPYRTDPQSGLTALQELRWLYDSATAAGTPDPFLTETVADETVDPHEAIRLYEAAIEQCAGFPGEPLHTKRRDLAQRLHDIGEFERAREQLELAIEDAKREGELEEAQHLADTLQKFY